MTTNDQSPGMLIARLDRIPVWSLPGLFIGIIGVGFLFTSTIFSTSTSRLSRPASKLFQTARRHRQRIISAFRSSERQREAGCLRRFRHSSSDSLSLRSRPAAQDLRAWGQKTRRLRAGETQGRNCHASKTSCARPGGRDGGAGSGHDGSGRQMESSFLLFTYRTGPFSGSGYPSPTGYTTISRCLTSVTAASAASG